MTRFASDRCSTSWLPTLVAAALCGCGAGGDSGVAARASGPALSDAVPSGFKCFEAFGQDDATIHLLYVADGRAEGIDGVYYVRSEDAGETWLPRQRIDDVTNPPHRASHTNAAQIAAFGDHLVAVWTTKGTGFMGGGPMASVVSSDGGATWKRGPAPYSVSKRDGQAFLDIEVDDEGVFHLVWLGNLEGTEGPKSLLYASSSDFGASWSTPDVVDPATCECCWNRLSLGGDGSLFALYRDLDPRDMGVARREASTGAWDALGRVGAFDWQYNGCPHVGGGLLTLGAADALSVHAVVWTGKQEDAGAYYFRSVDGGATWSAPRALGAKAVNTAIAGREGGPLVLAWDTRSDGASRIYVSLSFDDGEAWSEPLTLSAADVTSELPTVVPTGDTFRVFWWERDASGPHLRSRALTRGELSHS